MNNKFSELLIKQASGTALATASGISFFFLCMILPLVGPAGSRVDHAGQNRAVFVLVLSVTFALAGLAAYSKVERRKAVGGSLPWYSLGLCALCICTFITLLLNGFSV